MRFVEGATLLRALIVSESSDQIEVLVERAEEVQLSLHHRARGTPHHVILVTAAFKFAPAARFVGGSRASGGRVVS